MAPAKAPDYRHMPPIGQIDAMSCWAACFAWWLKAMGRKPSTQMELISEFNYLCGDDGGMTKEGLKTLVATPRFNMQMAEFDLVSVAEIRETGSLPLVDGPNLIAYYKFIPGPGIVGMHMNVVWNQRAKGDSSIVTCMDPAYPADAGNGKRKGAIFDIDIQEYLRRAPVYFACSN